MSTWAVGDFGVDVASSRHLEGQRGVDGHGHGGVGALHNQNTEAPGLAPPHLHNVVAALLGRLLRPATNEWDARRHIREVLRTLLFVG